MCVVHIADKLHIVCDTRNNGGTNKKRTSYLRYIAKSTRDRGNITKNMDWGLSQTLNTRSLLHCFHLDRGLEVGLMVPIQVPFNTKAPGQVPPRTNAPCLM